MAVTLSLAYDLNSQSIANNTSNVTVYVRASWTGGSYNATQRSGWVTIDGVKYTFTSSFNTGRTTSGTGTLFTKTVNVSHNSDGTKTLAVSGSYSTGVSSGTIGASFSRELTTIPRKSTLSVANGTLNTAQTLTVTRQATAFTHTITAKCGTASATICTKSTSTSISFTPPIAWASQNTTGTSISVTYTITTYNGDTSVGSNSYTKSCSIPASVKPSCTVAVSDAMGYESTYGGYIKGKSKFAVTVTPATSYGSAIASYTTTANGSTYTTASFTTAAIKIAGSLTITATVKDKRGRSGSASETKTVLDYTEPVVSRLSVRRCNADGTENAQGEYVQATFSAKISSLNAKNTANYVLRYKKSTDSAYTEVPLDNYAGAYTVADAVAAVFPAETGSSYNVQLLATDGFTTNSRAASASTAYALMHFGADGTSIGFGKLAEHGNTADFGMHAVFRGNVGGSALGLSGLEQIPENADFNDYTQIGCFAVYANAVAATVANIPAPVAGRLIVKNSTGMDAETEAGYMYLTQRFEPYKLDYPTYEREVVKAGTNSGWTFHAWTPTGWHRPEIPAGEDFNNVTDYGAYTVGSVASYAYLNCPAKSGTGLLEVFNAGTAGQKIQRLTTCSTDTVVWQRAYYSSAWSHWKKIYTTGTVLWSGAYYMTEGHTANLSELVSDQPNGIVLVFSRFVSGAAQNYHFTSHFVPKAVVASHLTNGHCFIVGGDPTFAYIGAKYLYLHDDKITGNADNSKTGTGTTGITYGNSSYVMRYVIGV